MARRRLLSDEQLAPFWAWASDERAIVRAIHAEPGRSRPHRQETDGVQSARVCCAHVWHARICRALRERGVRPYRDRVQLLPHGEQLVMVS
jgi:hypothetical protein